MAFSLKLTNKNPFYASIKGMLRSSPKNIELYLLAVQHSSTSKESNERLEFLGDAVLGSIIADYLFKKYPFKNEGFLTEIRSRIVKRDSLNGIAQKVGLDKIMQSANANLRVRNSSVYGNALEAFIGAVYLDKGFKFTYNYIIDTLIIPHIDIEKTIKLNTNYKSSIIEWGQKNQRKIEFKIVDEEGEQHSKKFTACVIIDDKEMNSATAVNKKRAEQAAAKKAIEQLGI